jgi:RNA polymerase sigma-70 factor (sigma-E family)
VDAVIKEEAQTSDVALRAAFDRCYAAMLRLCMALGDQRGDAEDIVQEAFVRAAPKLGDLEPGVVKAYLRQVVLNLRLDRIRATNRFGLIRGRHAEDHASAVDERDVLWSALMGLPERQRACLVLRFYEDLPEREVARLLGCSVGSVKSHTHRGLARLRKEVKP